MEDENHKEFIKKSREYYKSMEYIECPAFNGERIYFTNIGFHHLLYKNNKIRTESEQRRRLGLIKYIIYIIKNSKKYIESNKKGFYSLSSIIDNKIITIVIIQINSNKKIFLSIFDKKLHITQKTPKGLL